MWAYYKLCFWVSHLILLELPIDQQCRLFFNLFSNSMSHSIVWIQALVETCITVFIINILFSMSAEGSTVRVTGKKKQSVQEWTLDFIILDDVLDIHFRHIFTVRVRNLLFFLCCCWRGLRLLLLFFLFDKIRRSNYFLQMFQIDYLRPSRLYTSSSSSSSEPLSSLSERGATS